MLNRKSLTASFLVLIASVFMINSISFAEYGEKRHGKKWRKDHPRQNEVNNRLQNQTNKANSQEQSGEITKTQANQMKREDRRIYQQEQADKLKNGGNYIKPGQQAKLNREENAVNRQDKRDITQDANAGAGAPPPPAPANGN